MRKNKFSSAADRRWQRRYERIQQRKLEEKECKDRQTQVDEFLEFGIEGYTMNPMTRYITYPSFDAPNRNCTVIKREAYEKALEEFWAARDAYEKEEFLRSIESATPQRGYRARSHTLDEWFDYFVDIDDLSFGDKASWSIDWCDLEYPEPELDAGDIAELDVFLKEFSHV